ncbi:SOS response-associated peptidase [Siculibacillus lacustris]|uniref:Abasic site processing protein n=1 Tax=Siculibacillus lacustris TaxID=1549641 RepID=A0A4Q9VIB7_9HYPH|nr:SOS response-associated peptidase [Siculibacillus lacustris]TBW34428.1 SOS response-associated peptidase [Siculibacillus lacustris]
MCGRFALTATPDEVRRLFEHLDRPDFPPRDEIAPTEPIGVVRRREGVRRFDLVRWGFIPSWAADPGAFALVINARAETATVKPSFRAAMRHGRCLIPATAWWEWRRDPDGRRRPFRIAAADGGLLAFAGLVETWAGADGSEIDTAAILTTAANPALAVIHDRMPAILPPADFAAWLDTGNVDAAAAARLLRPAPEAGLVAVATPTAADRRRAERAAAPRAPAAPRRTASDDQLDLF